MPHASSLRALVSQLAFLAPLVLFRWGPASAASLEGVAVDETLSFDGSNLVLVGAGVHKRGYSKFSVEAIYATERRTTIDGLIELKGPKRLQIVTLRDIPGRTVARHFVSDLEQQLSEVEFKSLIPEITLIGKAFGQLHDLKKGEIIRIDWAAGKGMAASLNGSMVEWDNGSTYINNPLIFNVLLRIHAGKRLPVELQQNMLGLSKSMQSVN